MISKICDYIFSMMNGGSNPVDDMHDVREKAERIRDALSGDGSEDPELVLKRIFEIVEEEEANGGRCVRRREGNG